MTSAATTDACSHPQAIMILAVGTAADAPATIVAANAATTFPLALLLMLLLVELIP
jgi:hypothetical protein